MTSDTQTSDPEDLTSVGEPSPARTVELLIVAALRATTPEWAAPAPKLPPYRGD